MATNKEHYKAGGGDAEFEKLRKNYQYRNYDDAYLRRLVEQKGKRALAGPRRDAARDLSDEEAFKAGGGNAALENLKGNYQYRNQSDDFLRGLVSQRGRRAVAGGPADNAPKPDKKTEDLKITKDSSVEDKQAAANAARRAGQLSNIPAGAPVDNTEPETPGAGAQEAGIWTQGKLYGRVSPQQLRAVSDAFAASQDVLGCSPGCGRTRMTSSSGGWRIPPPCTG